jgi:hypothetical protein
MNQRIRDLAITGGIYDCICDPYDKLKNGDPYSSVMIDLERFALLIVQECMDIANEYDAPKMSGPGMIISGRIEQHFGVEQ